MESLQLNEKRFMTTYSWQAKQVLRRHITLQKMQHDTFKFYIQTSIRHNYRTETFSFLKGKTTVLFGQAIDVKDTHLGKKCIVVKMSSEQTT